MNLDEREARIFSVLEKLSGENVILIGGYAVNAYVLPRFSIDCDLILEKSDKRIDEILAKSCFKEVESGKLDTPYGGGFKRFEGFSVSVDLLVGGVLDRATKTFFPYDFILKNSKQTEVVGRTTPSKIRLSVASPEALFIMKFVSCRRQDIRDIFMFSGLKLDSDFITAEIKAGCGEALPNSKKIREIVENPSFKNSLEGVYGFVPENVFEGSKKNLIKILDNLENQNI